MDERGSEPRRRTPGTGVDGRLDSWKEIAAYFRCSERTVRRWEQTERLPVHRHAHSKKAAIYAYRAELDAWWDNGHPRLERQRVAAIARQPGRLWLGLAAMAVVIGAAVSLLFLRSLPQSPAPSLKITPLTSYPGTESRPALSPDGTQVAFLWTGETGTWIPDLYVKGIDASKPLRLTNTPDGYESSPTWSPDGSEIAFSREYKSGAAVWVIRARGGTERKLAGLHQGGLGLDWSPDGRYLAFADRDTPRSPSCIYLVSPGSQERRQLIVPPADSRGDSRPAFSPDSSALAFVRTGTLSNSIMISSITGGQPRALVGLPDGPVAGVAWSSDGRHLIYSAPVFQGAESCSLWRIPAGGGTPVRLTRDLDDAYSPTTSRRGSRLAYARSFRDVNIWRLEVADSGRLAEPPSLLIGSTRHDGAPQLSPDGKKAAFQSDRLGRREIWICDSDGSNPIQLTFSNGARAGSPRWSPDGRHIAFNLVAGSSDRRSGVYVVAAQGGTPRALVSDPHDAAGPPAWSRDGKWIYFGSDRSGRIEIWKVPSDGGQASQVTRNGGIAAFESVGGRRLYYTKADAAGLWRMEVEGGAESRILDSPEPAHYGFWAIVKEGLYFLDESAPPHGALAFYSLATRQVTRILVFDKDVDTWNASLAVSPDGRRILFARIDSEAGDLVLMENLR